MIQVVEHAPQEGPYAIGAELAAAGLPVRVCRVWAGDPVPRTTDGRVALVVMGGPMSAHGGFPGRTAELALLRAALDAEVPVLGVCLGAQLLAVAAGGAARPGGGAQIGWGEVAMAGAAHDDPLFAAVPARLRVLHWHSDTMDLPAGATLLASCDRYPVLRPLPGAGVPGRRLGVGDPVPSGGGRDGCRGVRRGLPGGRGHRARPAGVGARGTGRARPPP